MFDLLMQGFMNALNPMTLLIMTAGTTMGIIIGATPGLTGTMGVALLVPLTFTMEPATGLLLLSGIYCGSYYGGSISAILLNCPGTPAAACTTFDGHPMAKRGESGRALGMSAIASSFGGLVSAVALIFIAPPLAKFALKFGPPEYFALAVFGLTVIASLSAKNMAKGLLAGAIGLSLATVGMDPIMGFPRFTAGFNDLLEGIQLIPALIGLFSMPQVFNMVSEQIDTMGIFKLEGKMLPSLKEVLGQGLNLIRSSIIGTVVGIMPGAGSSASTFIAYNEAMRFSKHPEKFGTGILDGVAAAESSNNAVSGGSLIPLLTLGIPGNSVSAVFLGGLLIHGLRPGPRLFVENAEIVYTLLAGFFIANILVFIVGMAIARVSSYILRVPYAILAPAIFVFSVIGSFAIRNNFVDVIIMILFGFIGWFLKRYNIPVAPIVLAIILGPMAESSARRSLLMSDGDLSIFVTRPISLVLLFMAVFSMAWPFIRKYLDKKKENDSKAKLA